MPYPSLGSLFKGRGDFVQKLHDSLTRRSNGRAAIVSEAIYGLGGIGKTRTAVEYAWAHQDEYTALLFVIADSPQALHRNLAALTKTLMLPEREALDEPVQVHAVLNWLKANPGWLLILDNVDTNETLAETERVIAQLTGGQVLMTSRLANFPGDVEPLELDLLAEHDATQFLLQRTAGRRQVVDDEEGVARELATENLGRLALALEHAAAYMVRHQVSFARYREVWQTNRDKVLAWSDPAESRLAECWCHLHTVAQTVSLSPEWYPIGERVYFSIDPGRRQG